MKPAALLLRLSLLGLASIAASNRGQDRPLYLDPKQPLEARVADLLSKMTLDEKISLLHGDSKFTTNAIPRLGIPRRWMSDGPHGVREDVGPDTWDPAGHTDDFSSYMPVNICLASSWNPSLANAYGTVIGQEARARGKHIMLGPGMNIMRTPLNGRNFEYMGEDPWLASRMGIGYIQGAQAQEISSCAKHFAGNNQEDQRGSIDVEMDDRTLHEIYLPAFKAAVKEAGVWSFMGAYNKFRGQYCCENDLLLNKILKGDWGFKGLVMSDWGGAHDTKEAAENGLDLEMGSKEPYSSFYLADAYRDGLIKGTYSMSTLDDKVRRNLRVMFATHAIDGRAPGTLNTAAHQATARRVAEEGMVLLKNDRNFLPLDASRVKSIAVIGESATFKFASGGGSAGLKAFYEVTPLEGLIKRLKGEVNISYSAGYRQAGWRRRGDPSPFPITTSEDMIQRAVTSAKNADVAIVFAGLNHGQNEDSEGADRKDLKLPYNQDELIRRVVAANPRTVVVLINGGPVEMGPWLSKTPALLEAWYPGMEGGNAIAETLFGDVNPSGKLPCTFPKQLADSPAHALHAYPGVNGVENYVEGLFVGYRWYDAKNIEPLFPFGYGLSYTHFDYTNATLTGGRSAPGVMVDFDLKNSGARDGAEIAEVYVQPGKEKVERPVRELKAFRKVFLKAGETQHISIALDVSAFAYYDPAQRAWVAEAGDYVIRVGSSSRDLPLSQTFHLAQTTVIPD